MRSDWSVQGKTCLVTGASSGVGRISAFRLAEAGANVVLAVRNIEKVAPIVEEIQQKHGADAASVLELNLASLESCAAAAATFLESDRPLHVLLNNAGLAGIRGKTGDGFELAFGTNHLGHFLFTELLLERLKSSAPARIINVSSRAHYQAKTFDFATVQDQTGALPAMNEYSRSKLANVLHAKALAKRLAGTGITTYALHPGVVATDVWRAIPRIIAWIPKLFMLSEEDGAKTQLYCAMDPGLTTTTGLFYDDSKEKKPSSLALDDDLAAELERKSLDWVAPWLAP